VLRHAKSHWRSYMEVGLAIVTILALLQAVFNFHINLSSPDNDLSINKPDASISRCATITGAGRAGKGDELWISSQISGDDNIYIRPTQDDSSNPKGWRVRASFGDTSEGGHLYFFQVFAIDEHWAQFIRQLMAGALSFGIRNLPPYVRASKPVAIYREKANSSACS
jgi:hypothetical protein